MLEKLKKVLGLPSPSLPGRQESRWERVAREHGVKLIKGSPDDPVLLRLNVSPEEVKRHLEYEESQKKPLKK
jgi:hypothetical protein